MGDQKPKYTHMAVNKRTGEIVPVIYEADTNQYKENSMICLIEKYWNIDPITSTPIEER